MSYPCMENFSRQISYFLHFKRCSTAKFHRTKRIETKRKVVITKKNLLLFFIHHKKAKYLKDLLIFIIKVNRHENCEEVDESRKRDLPNPMRRDSEQQKRTRKLIFKMIVSRVWVCVYATYVKLRWWFTTFTRWTNLAFPLKPSCNFHSQNTYTKNSVWFNSVFAQSIWSVQF